MLFGIYTYFIYLQPKINNHWSQKIHCNEMLLENCSDTPNVISTMLAHAILTGSL